MNEWLKLMLDEIRRKQREAEEARHEHERRRAGKPEEPGSPSGDAGSSPPADSPGAR